MLKEEQLLLDEPIAATMNRSLNWRAAAGCLLHKAARSQQHRGIGNP